MTGIYIRADSSTAMGSGHLMRCLALADELRQIRLQTPITFICRDLEGSLLSAVRARGFALRMLPRPRAESGLSGYASWLGVTPETDAAETLHFIDAEGGAELLVVDHYALDETWEHTLRRVAQRILVIDDLADRRHDCDALIDQTLGISAKRYVSLVPPACHLLLGTPYVILHQGFYRLHPPLRTAVSKILVFFGGSDDTGETGNFLTALAHGSGAAYQYAVIVGAANPARDSLQKRCTALQNVSFHCQVDNMFDFIADADLAFGAAGGNTWERCILGLPAVVTVTAANQSAIAAALPASGAAIVLGFHDHIGPDDYAHALDMIPSLPVASMSRAAFSLIGQNRLREALTKLLDHE